MDTQRVCHTIHNFKHQGIAGANVLWATGLGRPDYYFHRDRLGDDFNHSAINFMKGGIVYSNFVTTVSPQHAWEARHTDQGHGLGHTLHVHAGKFGGVLNGIDYDMWNPETDPHIAERYTAETVDKKYANKEALRERLWLRKDFKPIVAYVGRLDQQKGVHLIRHAIFYALDRGAQFVLLGSSPELGINNEFWQLKHHLNESPDCHLEIGYDEELAHLIYAGADMVVLPSLFEPCGLTQMIALRYGTVPVVRAVGGLVDTVFDRDHSGRPPEERNGYVFHQADFPGLESAMHRAIGLWYEYPDEFRKLVVNGMRYDYSWNRPGHDYLSIYEMIRHK
jgi:starch synthase